MFAGFTATATNGAPGSRFQLHALCAASFPGSHLCHSAEYFLSNSATPVPTAGAWLDMSAFENGTSTILRTEGTSKLGRYAGNSDGNNCQNWSTAAAGMSGTAIFPDDVHMAVPCTSSLVVACCSSPFREKFLGYTTTTYNGAAPGGRAEMNFRCGSKFAGSHLCHATEFHRSHSTVAPPASGAWLDISTTLQGTSTVLRSGMATTDFGRYTSGDDTYNCAGWTSASSSRQGAVAMPTDMLTAPCSSLKPLACCE